MEINSNFTLLSGITPNSKTILGRETYASCLNDFASAIINNDQPVIEVRAKIKDGGLMVGYFNNAQMLTNEVQGLDKTGKTEGIWYGLNPIPADFIYKGVANKMEYRASATKDADILRRKRILVDFDPIRFVDGKKASHISSTDAEKEEAHKRAIEVYRYLLNYGFPTPEVVDSGNGYHLIYYCNLPNDESSTSIVESFLTILHNKFSTDKCDIDTSNSNASRICKLPYTTARKGNESTNERPWRMAVVKRDHGGELKDETLVSFIYAHPQYKGKKRGKTVDKVQKKEKGQRPNLLMQFSDLLGQLRKKMGTNLFPSDRDEWVSQGMCWAYCTGKEGVDKFCEFSSMWEGFNAEEDRAKYLSDFCRSAERTAPSVFYQFCENYDVFPELNLIPLDGLPEQFRMLITSASKAFQAPQEFLFAAVVTAFNTAWGGKTELKWDEYTNLPLLWFGLVANAGVNKTAPVEWVFKPLHDIERKMHEEYRRELAAWNETERKGPRPMERGIIIKDTTPEVRNKLLQNNDICLYSDELAGLIKNTNRYHPGAEIQDLLSLFSGVNISVRRMNTDSILIDKPYMSIIGGIQPEQLSVFSGYIDNGLVQRFLWVWNDYYPTPDYKHFEISDDIKSFWNAVIERSLEMRNDRENASFELDEEAQAVYIGYKNRHAKRIRSHGLSEDFITVLKKGEIHVLRLAHSFHLMHKVVYAMDPGGQEFPVGSKIDATTMRYAVACMDYFEVSGQKVLSACRGRYEKGDRLSKMDTLRMIIEEHPERSQKEWAEFLGVSQQYISKILKSA